MKTVYIFLSLLACHVYAGEFIHIDEYTYLKNVQYGANKFAVNLYKTTLKNEPGNSIISPFSVYMVLAMASHGAEGVTREELLNVLHLPKQTEVGPSIGAGKSLRGIIHKFNIRSSVFISIAHKIFARSGLSLNPNYQDILENVFRSPVVEVDFTYGVQTARIINQWIRSVTSGKIDGIIDPVELDASMKLMLVNSIYFSGRWEVPFEPLNSWPTQFHVNEKLTREVLVMYQTGNYRHGELPGMNAKFVAIPYQNDGNSKEIAYMHIILPNELNGLATLEENIDSLTLEDLENTTIKTVELALPKFKIVSKFLLKDHLSQLGIESAFTATANFDGMTTKHEDLTISQVVQKTFITVDEMGTEAAAIYVTPSIFRLHGIPFTVDRPFLIVLATDDVILFIGKVMDPSV